MSGKPGHSPPNFIPLLLLASLLAGCVPALIVQPTPTALWTQPLEESPPAPSPTPSPSPTPTPAPTAGKYDGTYDFSITYPTSGTTVATSVVPRFFIIRNGAVSSSDATVAGTILDTFGNVRFTGPCPHGDGMPNPNLSATFTGIMNAGAGPKFGQGTYVCRQAISGTKTWRAYNGS